MSAFNNEICLAEIRDILGLRPQASPAATVAKVREAKAAADLAGAALKARGDSGSGVLAPSIRVPV